MTIYQYLRPNYYNHSQTNAYLMALLSYYIYETEVPNPVGPGAPFAQKFRATFSKLGPPDHPFDIVVETATEEYAVLANPEVVILAFRGSEPEWQDWVGNLGNFPSQMMAAPPAWGSPQVHANFYLALDQVYPKVLKDVSDRLGANSNLFITGHSRGGSLATLCAYRMQQVNKIDVSGVYTFGGTRVGNSHFRELYRNAGLWNKTFRWVRNNDAGPKWPDYAPLAQGLTQYYHVGQLNFIAANGVNQLNKANPDQESGPMLEHWRS